MSTGRPTTPLPARTSTTFHDVLGHWAVQTPGAPAFLTETGDALGFKDVLGLIAEIGASLNACGFGRGDRIAVVHPGGIDLAMAIAGIWSHATAIPLGPNHRLGEYAMYLRDLRADAVAIAAGDIAPAREAAAHLGLPVLDIVPDGDGGSGWVRLEGPASDRPHEPGLARPEDIAAVIMTSGTTLERKMVPRRQFQLALRAEEYMHMLRFSPDERVANMMQLYHGAGLGAITYAPFAGASVAHFPGKDLTRIFTCLESLQPTHLTGPYTVFHAILNQRERLQISIDRIRSNVRMLRTGSGHLDANVAEKLETLFDAPVIQAYSSSETGFLACEPLPPTPRKRGSVGLPGSNEIAIVDSQGNRQPTGTEGEIAVRGPKIFDGYENNPEANAKAFHDGWFRMGDLGYFDADGYLFLTGRIKEVINRGGQKIMPAEVDAALMDHPDIADAATFPVPHPTLGEDVAAAIVQKPGATLDRDTLMEYLRQRLDETKVPHRFLFVDDIPKGAAGKVQRKNLAAAFGLDDPDFQSDAEHRLDATTPTEATLQKIWGETLQRPTVPLDEDFFTLGGDSIMAVELFLRIEEELGRRLPRTVLLDCGTVEKMAAAIDREYRADCLVPIQTAGDRPIFFCVHGIDGDVLYFRDLARHLGETQPFYGIRAQGLDKSETPGIAIPDMASRYIEAIRRIQPTGPYYLGGYSFGGWVAYEIARQLREDGNAVAFLAILDTKYSGGRPHQTLLTRLRRTGDTTPPGSGNSLFTGSRVQAAANHLRLDMMTLAVRLGLMRGRLAARFRQHPIEAHNVATRRYRPAPYDGNAILFHTADRPQYAGWDRHVRGKLETCQLGGNHTDMLYDPGVRNLAEALKTSLAAAMKRSSS